VGTRHELIAVRAAHDFFSSPSVLFSSGTLFTDQLRAIEAIESGLTLPDGITPLYPTGVTIPDPQDYKIGPHPNWNNTPALFFIAEEAIPENAGAIREHIRTVGLIIGAAYMGSTDTDTDELTILRYLAAIRATVESNFQLGSSNPNYVAGCIEVEADRILDMTDHAATRKTRFVKFQVIVQDNN
jgi:hypothetical protein